jgi:hypothetical protein
MGIGVGIFLIAAGAILTWGVTSEAEGLNIDAIGVILMVVGLIGVLISLMFWSSWGGFGGIRRRTVVEDGGHVERPRGRTTRIVEEREDAGPPPA